ncbi:MAG: hypothetical protein K5880_22475 [Hydrogenophaga sp.]|jgi:hypothetical protein|nr:hypothetical protein [Hydrogenophaga sp.]
MAKSALGATPHGQQGLAPGNRQGARGIPHQGLYGLDHFLCFDARLGQVGVLRKSGKHFVDDSPEALGVDHAEADDEIDEATDTMPPWPTRSIRALEGEGLMLAFASTVSDDEDDFVQIGRMVCEAFELEGLRTERDGTANVRVDLAGLRKET